MKTSAEKAEEIAGRLKSTVYIKTHVRDEGHPSHLHILPYPTYRK
jgi:hypothetical protein